MTQNSIAPDWPVEQVLKQSPQAVEVFLRFKTDCVGCWLARFCTLQEVSRHYQLDSGALVSALQATAVISDPKE